MTPRKQRAAGPGSRVSVDVGEPDPGEPLMAAEAPGRTATANPAAPSAGPGPGRAADRRGRLRAVAPWLVVCCYLIGAVAVTARLWADPAGRDQLGGGVDVDLFAWFVRYAATAVGHGHLPELVTAFRHSGGGT